MADAYQYVQYTGPKASKEVTFLASRPVFNEGNNFTAVLDNQEAGHLIRQCKDIFRIVNSPTEPRPTREAVTQAPAPRRSRREPVEATEEPTSLQGDGAEGDDVEEELEENPTPESTLQIYGKANGEPFGTLMAAKAQLPRIATRLGITPDSLEAVEFADGIYVVPKEDSE